MGIYHINKRPEKGLEWETAQEGFAEDLHSSA